MKIEQSQMWPKSKGRAWLVHVQSYELVVESGKTLPYPCCIGTIVQRKQGGRVVLSVWTPAASHPRGYNAAARLLLEKAEEELRQKDTFKVPS